MSPRWILAVLVAPLVAHAEVLHDMQILVDPDARRVLVEDTISGSDAEPVLVRLPRASGIGDVSVDDSPVDKALERISAASKVRVSYVWRVPSRFTDSGQGAVLDPDGGYLPAFPEWLPRAEGRAERYRFTVTTAAAQRVVATGTLLKESLSDEGYRATFELAGEGAVPSLFVGPYEVTERYVEGVRLRTYFYADHSDLAEEYLRAVAEYVRHYGELIGAYPYADFHVVAGPLPVGFAFRNLTYISRQILRLPYMKGRSLAHEVLHSWWGGGVRVEPASGNWAEGLTTYMADYAVAERRGDAAALEMRLGWLRDYAALPPGRDHALQAFRSRTHDASQVVGYGKTAFVFHMLRQALGEADFIAGIRLFWQSNRFRSAGWGDLRGAFEYVSGVDLEPFFAQWVDRPGAPRLAIADANVTSNAGEHVLRFVLVQDDPVYQLEVPIRVETATGAERFTVSLHEQRGPTKLPLSGRPHEVSVDPDFDLFRRLAPEELPPIIRDTTLAIDVAVVLATTGPGETGAGQRLAARILDLPGERLMKWDPSEFHRPLLLIGVGTALPRVFLQAGIDEIPPELSASGTARVWALRAGDGFPRLAILADDQASLEALIGPLSHYGRKSWLVFRSSTATQSGVWPSRDSPLHLQVPG